MDKFIDFQMIIPPYVSFVLGVLGTYFYLKRDKNKTPLTYFYTFLFIGGIFFFGGNILASSVKKIQEIATILPESEAYTAKMIDTENSVEKGKIYYYPIVSFQTKNGKIVTEKLPLLLKKQRLQDFYEIRYNENLHKILVVGTPFYIKSIASVGFSLLSLVLILGILLYIFKENISWEKRWFSLLLRLGIFLPIFAFALWCAHYGYFGKFERVWVPYILYGISVVMLISSFRIIYNSSFLHLNKE